MKKILILVSIMTLSIVHSALLRGNWLIAAPYDQHYADMAYAFLNGNLTIDKDIAAENRKLVQPYAIADGAVLKADQAANTVIYSRSGNQDVRIPDDTATPGNYRTLTFSGSGTRNIGGSGGTVNVRGTYTTGGLSVTGTVTNIP